MSTDRRGSDVPPQERSDAFDAELVRLAGRLARCGGWALEVPLGETYWTAELFGLLGYEPTAGAPPYELMISWIPPGYREIVESAVERCIADGTQIDLESVILDSGGRELRVRIAGEAVRDSTGAVVRIQGACHDITEIVKEREDRIAAQENLWKTLDYFAEFVFFIDETWHITFANQAMVVASGLLAEQLYSETLWTLFPEVLDTALRPLYERAMIERVSGTARQLLEQRGMWLDVAAHPVEGGIAVLARDITEAEERRLQVEEVSTVAQERAALLDTSSQAIFMEDLDNVVTYWNQGAEQVYGWTRQEAVGRNIRELIYDDLTLFEERMAALRHEGNWRGEMVQRTKDGRPIIVEGNWQVVFDENGHPVKFFAANSDVTAQRRQQELLSRAQRLESLGTLAGGIAHDLNNVLTPLLMSVHLMRDDEPSLGQAALLDGMEVAVTRGADMVRQVLSFARGVDGVHHVVDLADVVQELSTMSLQTLPKSIAVTTRLGEQSSIVGDKTQILQVLMNLVTNARDAMDEGGELTLSMRQQAITVAEGAAMALAPGAYALVTVEDSGAGMSGDVLGKIFEPFFTTKAMGDGTGLGLASSMSIVKSHGGAIVAYSEQGVGSSFTVYLPLAGDDAAVSQSVAHEQPAPDGSGELVLVVDDEVSIRNLLRLTLETHGYRVVEASDGREAIEVFGRHSDDVALIFTDMMMPVMDGAATAAYFFEHHPHVPVVAASGLNAYGGLVRASNSGVRRFVSKPFTTNTLLNTLYAALHE